MKKCTTKVFKDVITAGAVGDRLGSKRVFVAGLIGFAAASFDQGNARAEWLERVKKIREALTRDGRTLTQGALGWIWARSPATIPIPGFRTVKQVEENVGALQFDPLPETVMNEIAEQLKG